MEPVTLEAGGRTLRVLEVAQHQMRRAVHDLADFAHGHVFHGIVDHTRFHVEHRLAAGTGFAQLVVRAEHGGQRRDLGLAIQVPQPHGRQARRQLLQHLDRHDGRPVVALGQVVELGGVEQGRAQQRDPHRGRREEAGDLVLFDQCEQFVGRGLAGDDVAAADVDGRAEEHVELRAVVQRQGVQGAVGLGDLGVDDAAHVLPEHGVVREHGALGARLRAAGVDDLGQIQTAQRHLGQGIGAGGEFVEGVHASHRLARVFAGQPDELLDLRFQRRGFARKPGQAAVGGEGAGAGVAQDVGHLVGLEHEVDRHQHRATAGQRKAQRGKTVRVARQHGHLVAFANADAEQPGGQAADQRVELGVGPLRAAADDGGLVGQAGGGAVQGVGDGLAANHRGNGRCGRRHAENSCYSGAR